MENLRGLAARTRRRLFRHPCRRYRHSCRPRPDRAPDSCSPIARFQQPWAAWYLPVISSILSPMLRINHLTLPTNAVPMNSDEQLPEDSDPDDERTPFSEEIERPLIIQSEDLLQGRSEIWIEHRDEMYRLRLTSSGKLYLSK